MIGKDVESAYRAFKGSVYWDKTLSFFVRTLLSLRMTK